MSKLKPPFHEQTDHYKGNLDAPVQLLEYGDFQCPHCGAAHPMLKKIEETFGSSLLFIFRHFPLSESHPYAKIAAIASEAAAEQGSFWKMFDLIFENQNSLSKQMLLILAKSLHLNIKDFQKSLSDPGIAAKVDSDFESGIFSGVNGTPSFYINSQKYNGPYTYEGLSLALEMANRNNSRHA
jgi:protein-disulfide isomerase